MKSYIVTVTSIVMAPDWMKEVDVLNGVEMNTNPKNPKIEWRGSSAKIKPATKKEIVKVL